MDLRHLVSDDPRPPIERMRRLQLWKVADAYNIPYPAGAPKTVMVDLLKSMGVDVTAALPDGNPNDWEVVETQDERGRTSRSLYPISKPHFTASKTIDYDSAIEKAAVNNVNPLVEENNALKAMLAQMSARLDALENPKKPPDVVLPTNFLPEPTVSPDAVIYEGMKFFDLRALCKQRGIPYTLKNTKAELVEKLSGNTP